jgi:hypothetical protein
MGFPVPENADALLTRKATASALTTAGFPVAEKTLATKATRGGGPPFRKFGPRPLYRWGDALDWARSRLSPPMRSTSEADAAPQDRPATAEPARRRQEAETPEPASAR